VIVIVILLAHGFYCEERCAAIASAVNRLLINCKCALILTAPASRRNLQLAVKPTHLCVKP